MTADSEEASAIELLNCQGHNYRYVAKLKILPDRTPPEKQKTDEKSKIM